MAIYDNRAFANTTVPLDGNEFNGCTFESCEVSYGGGSLVLRGFAFNGCRLTLLDGAATTALTLKKLLETPLRAGALELLGLSKLG